MRKIWKILLSLWFPRFCSHCKTGLQHWELGLCHPCSKQLNYTHHFRKRTHAMQAQLEFRMGLYSVQSLTFFRKKSIEQKALHDLKYGGNTEVAQLFGTELASKINSTYWLRDVAVLLPIPLHWKKEKKRGYNQAEVLAKAIAANGSIILCKQLIKQVEGKGITKGKRYERMRNQNLGFMWTGKLLPKGTHVLLVDDVITTGATLEAAIHAIPNAHELKFSAVSIAHTL